jgi:hypothetical protein
MKELRSFKVILLDDDELKSFNYDPSLITDEQFEQIASELNDKLTEHYEDYLIEAVRRVLGLEDVKIEPAQQFDLRTL